MAPYIVVDLPNGKCYIERYNLIEKQYIQLEGEYTKEEGHKYCKELCDESQNIPLD